MISDIYIDDKYIETDVFEYMAKYLVNLYNEEEMKVLTKIKEEQEIWLKLGFEITGTRGNYAVMARKGNKC